VLGGGGAGAVVASVGVHLANGGQITAGGAGTVGVAGYGFAGGGNANYGILVQSGNSAIGSSGGAATVTGVSGNSATGAPGVGVFLFGGRINTSGTLALSDGSFIPGTVGTDLTTSMATFAAGTDLILGINGTTVDSEYTQLKVNGAVDLTGLDLTLVGSDVPENGDVYTLVSATSVTGTFNGLAQFSTIVFNGVTLTIIYTGTAVIAAAM